MKEGDMAAIADFIDRCAAIVKRGKVEKGEGLFTDEAARDALRDEVFAFTAKFPTFVY
jgi:hypothetical protein